MMALSRQEREELVLDLYYNQNKNYRQIAEEARICPRDIKTIVDKASNEKERREHKSLSTQAYELFSIGKRPVEVAIILNIRESEVTQYYREYWSLMQLDVLNQIYKEIKHDIWHFVNLYRTAKSSGMGVQHVVKLLKIANNDLPSVEYRYEKLKREINSKELEKQNLTRLVQEYDDQVTALGKRFDSCCLSCEQEEARLDELRKRMTKEESVVRHFENNNEAYVKITKTIEEKVQGKLSDKKALLNLALLSLTESVRNDPDKFSSLIYYDAAAYNNRSSFRDGQLQQLYSSKDSFKQGYIDMLNEEAEKLFISLEKMLTDEAIDQHASKTSSSLPMLPPEHQQ